MRGAEGPPLSGGKVRKTAAIFWGGLSTERPANPEVTRPRGAKHSGDTPKIEIAIRNKINYIILCRTLIKKRIFIYYYNL